MNEGKTNISVRRTARHWLRNGLTLLVEAFLWALCLHLASRIIHYQSNHDIILQYATCVVFYVITRLFIPSDTFRRTTRRDEVVACAMKTALIVCAIAVIFIFNHKLLAVTFLLFCVALTVGRLILNNWFIRYALRHSEHGIIICDEDSIWQQKALQQNTYGLKLARLERQTAQQLEEFLTAHPETESVYCAPSALSAAELEDVAHTCRKQGIVLHILPLAPSSLPPTMQSECRGTVSVLSPANPPLQNIFNRSVKRLTDIVLSLLVLLTVFPIFAFIAFICIKRQSKGPVLMIRHLCGMNGKVFQCLTFRTRHYEAAPSFLEGINDPGYFPFGKFLSHSRMELLPEFLCVLWGNMSIVGSQAMRPEQYAEYRREARHLFASDCRMKAGITSYQFAGQSKGSTKADVWYASNWGFWLDVRIMLQRLATLIRKSKAKSINYI